MFQARFSGASTRSRTTEGLLVSGFQLGFLPWILLGFLLALAPSVSASEAVTGPVSEQVSESATDLPDSGTSALCTSPAYEPIPSVDPKLIDNRTHLQSDKVNVGSDKLTRFSGSVVIQRGNSQLKADQADYSHSDENIHAKGNVSLMATGLYLTGSEARLNLTRQQGSMDNVTYRTSSKGRGTAEKVEIDGEKRLILENASYTSCDPSDPDWLLSADKITLNNENRQGSASDVVIRFKGVPFLYLPYMRFPIGDERLSGFLYPSIGSSDRNGTHFSLPYYWNIAPHRDATITPLYMSKRGTLLQNEFRYLNETNRGQFNLDYLDDDKIFKDKREQFRWLHNGNPQQGWSTAVDYNYVGDERHLIDFGNNLNSSSETYLQRKGNLSYNAELWSFNTLVQSQQILSGSEVYQRMPQLTLATRDLQQDKQLNYGINAEWVRFAHRDDVVQGSRFDARPAVSLPWRSSAGFLVPRVELRHTQYNLDPVTTTADETPSRTLPIVSLDSGLFFERETSFGQKSLTHTLEPRLLYAYIPYRDQDHLPLFDAADPGFSVNDPFRVNRFDGVDRVGDTNHITAGLISRLLDQQNGAELLMASIAQVFYFDDRRVSLIPGNTLSDNRSDIIAELTTRPAAGWYFHADTLVNEETEKVDSGNIRFNYKHKDRISLDLAYRYARDTLETNEAGMSWRLSPSWKLEGRQLYDMLNNRSQESSLSLRYDSCCWGLNLGARKRFIAEGEKDENIVMLELELKGLASFGNQ